jgi:hypothetical protein
MSEVTDLAREIQQDTGLDIDTAWKMAWQMMPDLLNDVMMDARYRPARVVLFDLMSAQELQDWTER